MLLVDAEPALQRIAQGGEDEDHRDKEKEVVEEAMGGEQPVAERGDPGAGRFVLGFDGEVALGIDAHGAVAEIAGADAHEAIVDDERLAVQARRAMVLLFCAKHTGAEDAPPAMPVGGAEGGEIGLGVDQERDALGGFAAPMGASVAQRRLGRLDHALHRLSLGITRSATGRSALRRRGNRRVWRGGGAHGKLPTAPAPKRTGEEIMKGLSRLALLVATAAPLLASGAQAQLIISGNDEKQTWDAAGKQVNHPPGNDTVSIIDIKDRTKPRIVASLPLMNTVVGPPVNLAITPDQQLALVANSLDWVKDGDSWKGAPDNKLYVIDLTTSPPQQIATVELGKQPSGMAINKAGTLALVANRADDTVSVLSISGKEVKVVDTASVS